MTPYRDGRFGGTDWQRAFYLPLTILAWLAVVVVTAWLLGHIVKTILTLVFSGIVAFALTPLVNLLARWMPRILAIFIAYVIGFSIIFGLGALLVVTAADQVTTLVHNLPNYLNVDRGHPTNVDRTIVNLLQRFNVNPDNYWNDKIQLLHAATSLGKSVAVQSLAIVTSVFSAIVDIILVLILSVYLTANGPKIASRLRRESPGSQRRNTAILIAIVNQVVGGYVRGTLALASLIGALVMGGMFALSVPYAVLLGILAFFMEFIPVLGVLVSGAVCVLVAVATKGFITAALVLAYFVVVHVIEGDVVGPRIMGRAVGIHPATALIALVAGTELFGIWGALFGSPLAGLLQAIGTAAYQEIRGGDPAAVLHAAEDVVAEELNERDEAAEHEAEEDVAEKTREGPKAS